ncbi:MAG: hypothetical protein WC788_05175 [Candidatus Paceibacterota bacterium]|jgi:hypothetical protein
MKKNYILSLIVLLVMIAIGSLLYLRPDKPNSNVIQPVSDSDNKKNESDTANEDITLDSSEITNSKWKRYANKTLGFSINLPGKVSGLDRCDSKDNFLVSLKTIEDNENNVVYIVPEYYFDDYYGEDIKNPKQGTSNCETKIYDLRLINDEVKGIGMEGKYISKPSNPFLGIAIKIVDIKNDMDLDRFIKEDYGAGCFAGEKNLWTEQEGVYDVNIKGEDWDKVAFGESTCFVNYVAKILYYPEKGKVMSVKLGQEPNFYLDIENLRASDEDMINSFRFE